MNRIQGGVEWGEVGWEELAVATETMQDDEVTASLGNLIARWVWLYIRDDSEQEDD